MEITRLTIERKYNFAAAGMGSFKATVYVKGENADMTLFLDEARTLALIEQIADLLVSSTRDVAAGLTRDALSSAAAQIELSALTADLPLPLAAPPA